MKQRLIMLALLPVLSCTTHATAARLLIDAHLHYNTDDADLYSPARIDSILKQNNIDRAIVTSHPPGLASSLYEHDPELFIPILGVYQTNEDKHAWITDSALPAKVKQMLDQGQWRGVGELHVFAEHRRSEVLLNIVAIAEERELPLLMHCDPAVIDSIFEYHPDVKVVWAHAGVYPYPRLLRDYLERYPRLYVDLSVRDERIAPGGRLDPEWESLLWEHPERFMVGVDTFSTERWKEYDTVATRIRNWLEQLPEDIASMIAFHNAANVYKSAR